MTKIYSRIVSVAIEGTNSVGVRAAARTIKEMIDSMKYALVENPRADVAEYAKDMKLTITETPVIE